MQAEDVEEQKRIIQNQKRQIKSKLETLLAYTALTGKTTKTDSPEYKRYLEIIVTPYMKSLKGSGRDLGTLHTEIETNRTSNKFALIAEVFSSFSADKKKDIYTRNIINKDIFMAAGGTAPKAEDDERTQGGGGGGGGGGGAKTSGKTLKKTDKSSDIKEVRKTDTSGTAPSANAAHVDLTGVGNVSGSAEVLESKKQEIANSALGGTVSALMAQPNIDPPYDDGLHVDIHVPEFSEDQQQTMAVDSQALQNSFMSQSSSDMSDLSRPGGSGLSPVMQKKDKKQSSFQPNGVVGDDILDPSVTGEQERGLEVDREFNNLIDNLDDYFKLKYKGEELVSLMHFYNDLFKHLLDAGDNTRSAVSFVKGLQVTNGRDKTKNISPKYVKEVKAIVKRSWDRIVQLSSETQKANSTYLGSLEEGMTDEKIQDDEILLQSRLLRGQEREEERKRRAIELEQQRLRDLEHAQQQQDMATQEQNRIIETKLRGGVPLTPEEQLAIIAKQEKEELETKKAIKKEMTSKKKTQAEIANKLSWKNQVLTNRMREVYDISYDVPEDFLNQTKRALNLWGIHVPGECQLDERNVREWDYNVFYMPNVPQRSRFTYNPFTSSLHMRTLTDTGYPQARDLNLEVNHAVKMCAIK